MKRLLLYTIKSVLTNPAIIGWGILFMLFYGIVGAYFEAPSFIHQLSSSPQQVSPAYQHIEYLQYTSGWYTDLVIISLSSIATGIAFTLYYQTGTLPYLIRYSKLKISTFFTSIYSGNLIASLLLELLLTAVITLMFSNNGVGIGVSPSNVGILILAIVLGSLFLVSFATFLALLIIKLHAFRLENLFNFLPLILGFLAYAIFTFTTITSPAVYYSNPYMTIEILLYKGYSGSFELYGDAGTGIYLHLSIGLLMLSTVAWIVILNLINYVLARKMYYSSVEEGRMM